MKRDRAACNTTVCKGAKRVSQKKVTRLKKKEGGRKDSDGLSSFSLFSPSSPVKRGGKGKIETWVGILDTRAVPQKKRKLSNFKI